MADTPTQPTSTPIYILDELSAIARIRKPKRLDDLVSEALLKQYIASNGGVP